MEAAATSFSQVGRRGDLEKHQRNLLVLTERLDLGTTSRFRRRGGKGICRGRWGWLKNLGSSRLGGTVSRK